jgi:ATP-dependent DNA helicase RecQ
VPVIALTATATPEVVIDIQDKMKFKKQNLFQKSFERKNLTYFVFDEEDKYNRLLAISRKVSGSGIVYVRNRKKTREISEFLIANKIKSDYYNAGLDPLIREKKQEAWIKNSIRVMVCTNAFGMGIDKPDVRFVIHTEPPDNLEAYFQEAGRAGRDERNSYAVLLYNKQDLKELDSRFELAYPQIEYARKVYDFLGTFLQVPLGGGLNENYDFDLNLFAENCNQNPVKLLNALKILERNDFILLTEAIHQPSRIMIKMFKDDLYRFQVRNAGLDPLIKLLLRSYPGLFSTYVRINENEIARRLESNTDDVVNGLDKLNTLDVLSYIKQTNKPQVIFLNERVESSALIINYKNYNLLKENASKRLEAVKHYLNARARCRNQLLLDYFGEKEGRRCGKCDVCLKRNVVNLSDLEFDEILEVIKPLLKEKPMTHSELVQKVGRQNSDKTLKVIRFLLDNGKIRIDNGFLHWN